MQISAVRPSRTFAISALILLLVGSDQLSKHFVRLWLTPFNNHSYLGDLVRIEHTENPGAFLSLGADLQGGLRFWIFTVVVAGILLFALGTLVRKKEMDALSTVGLTCIVGGGLGNLIDRMLFGSVTDFMNLGFGPVRTGIFNIADVAIVIGVLSLLLASFRKPKLPNESRGLRG